MKWFKFSFVIFYIISCIAALVYCITNWNDLLLVYRVLLIDYSLGLPVLIGNIIIAIQNCQINKEIRRLHSHIFKE